MATTTLFPIIGFGENEDAREGSLDYTNNNRPTVRFNQLVDSEFSFYFYVPTELSGTITAAVLEFGIVSETISNEARFIVQSANIADGESLINPTLTSETAEDITLPGTVNIRTDSVGTTLTNDPAKGDNVVLVLQREGTHINDDHLAWVHIVLETLRLVITH
jgi:hypothetical protein